MECFKPTNRSRKSGDTVPLSDFYKKQNLHYVWLNKWYYQLQVRELWMIGKGRTAMMITYVYYSKRGIAVAMIIWNIFLCLLFGYCLGLLLDEGLDVLLGLAVDEEVEPVEDGGGVGGWLLQPASHRHLHIIQGSLDKILSKWGFTFCFLSQTGLKIILL